jgi:hypothetical protein
LMRLSLSSFLLWFNVKIMEQMRIYYFWYSLISLAYFTPIPLEGNRRF